jgi:L-ascorbate metabolism protein UlaG (beta-lactamase superfamily)
MTVRLVAASDAPARVSASGEGRPAVTLTWLGQAGFLLQSDLEQTGQGRRRVSVLVDPYLSDSLAAKYAGTVFPHVRLAPPPITVDELPTIDLVLCTHRHTDHMDPETLRAVARRQPDCDFVVPAALHEHALGLGLPARRLLAADAGRPLEPVAGVRITPVLAAHEQLDLDDQGRSRNLGYVLTLGALQIYHSGDCVPYVGQVSAIAALGVQVALLPINGRDAYRLARGVPGNFHPHEAVGLATAIGADVLVGHHFGLFDFNTVDEADLAEALRGLPPEIQWVRPRMGERYETSGSCRDQTAAAATEEGGTSWDASRTRLRS